MPLCYARRAERFFGHDRVDWHVTWVIAHGAIRVKYEKIPTPRDFEPRADVSPKSFTAWFHLTPYTGPRNYDKSECNIV